ncbi:MAG: ATP-binding protein [Gammaproteobacteria bacterium]|nr:ATP-binding protein [Gammaproteobacteria bacterium]
MPELRSIFSSDLNPERILEYLSLKLDKSIIPGKTLLFFDEVQECPQGIIALRYFYEEMPQLHIIAAGSLLDFTIEEIGIPVGRVTFLYLYPMSFIEFLLANNKVILAKKIIQHCVNEDLPLVIHNQCLALLGEYMLTGGMPYAVKVWLENRDIVATQKIHRDIIEAYNQDFEKYAEKNRLKYVELLFNKIPSLISQPFKYTHLESPFQKRELAPCLDLLVKANIVYKIMRTTGNSIPLGADVHFDKFKLLFLDIALCQTVLGFTLKEWILDPLNVFCNKGALCEALIGQELLAYSPNDMKNHLYYWQREARSSAAEVDYLIAQQHEVIPIEVKSGKGNTLKSLHLFMKEKNSNLGIKFSLQNYSVHNGIHSYPLYAVAGIFKDNPLFENL